MAQLGQPSCFSFSLPLPSLAPSLTGARTCTGTGIGTWRKGRRAPTSNATSNATPSAATPSADTPIITTRLQKTRLRLHLLQLARQQRRNATSAPTPSFSGAADEPSPLFPSYMQNPFATAASPPPPPSSSSSSSSPNDEPMTNKRRKPTSSTSAASSSNPEAPARNASGTSSYSAEERRARSERLRARWRDPEWRAALLAKRKTSEASRRRSEDLKQRWKDEAWREKMRKARLGRPAPNKGVPASRLTRLRMSVARKGSVKSPEARRRMSAAKRGRPSDDEWRRLISESKKGKTREYFAMRREFRALYRDLKLWSDSFRAKHGRLPSSSSYERFVAPIMVFRIRRYLTLRDAIGDEEIEANSDIMSKD